MADRDDTRRVPRDPMGTTRNAPAVDGVAGRVAQRLREGAGQFDEISQARFERSLYEAWRTQAAATVDEAGRGRGRAQRRRRARLTWGLSVAAAAAAGALIAVGVWTTPNVELQPVAVGEYAMHLGGGAMQRGRLQQGEVLESGPHGHAELGVGYSRIEMGRRTTLRLDRIAGEALEVALQLGRIDVAFHPPAKGVQTLAIQTRSARVRVVGTRFSVTVDGRGDTAVAVTEGVVEVISRVDGSVRRVSAGQDVRVSAEAGDPVEQAVRDALQNELSDDEPDTSGDVDMDFLDTPDMDLTAPEVPAAAAAGAGAGSRPAAPRPQQVLSDARELLRGGQHADARDTLRKLTRSGVRAALRAEAHTLIAESFTAQGYVPRAEAAYRDAANAAPGLPAGHNAQFALARLLERYKQDRKGAGDAYRAYLERAPRGPLSEQAHRALCRLGDSAHCDRP